MKILGLNSEKTVLILILLLAFVVRFFSLTKFPVGFNADEASFGYDAHSIIRTGRDQWGSVPVVLKSFGDYKSPVYAYIIAPFVFVGGLNSFAVRLPNVIVGTLAVFILYLLFRELFPDKKKEAIVSAFLLALSPWSVMMSRGAFEANLVTLFIPLGIYLFLKSQKNTKYALYSFFIFGLSLFTYHSAKITTPLTILFLVVIYFKDVSKNLKHYILPVFVFSLFVLAMLYTLKIGGGARISERSITRGALEEGAKAKIELIQNGVNPNIARFFHNKYQVVFSRFTSNYLQYFSYKFYLSKGAGESYYGMRPGIGVLSLVEFILFVSSLVYFYKFGIKGGVLFVFLWLLISPLPAALSTGVGYSGHRAETMIPVLQIVQGLGLAGIASLLKKTKVNYVSGLYLAVFLSSLVFFSIFWKSYTTNIPSSSFKEMLYGNLEVFDWLNNNKGDKQVFVSRSLSEPQIFIGFLGMEPTIYQNYSKSWDLKSANVMWVDQLPEYGIENYKIKSIDWKNDTKNKNIMIVAKADEFPKDVLPDKIFSYPDGTANVFVKKY